MTVCLSVPCSERVHNTMLTLILVVFVCKRDCTIMMSFLFSAVYWMSTQYYVDLVPSCFCLYRDCEDGAGTSHAPSPRTRSIWWGNLEPSSWTGLPTCSLSSALQLWVLQECSFFQVKSSNFFLLVTSSQYGVVYSPFVKGQKYFVNCVVISMTVHENPKWGGVNHLDIDTSDYFFR